MSVKVSPPLSVQKVAEYYVQQYTSGGERYYSQGGTLEGEWYGKQAAAFGLEGAVHPEPYNRLAEGKDPNTGEQLIRWRYPAGTKAVAEPIWVKNDQAWADRLKEMYVEAIDAKHDIVTSARDVSQKDPTGHLPKIKTPELNERQAVLVDMHQIAADMYRQNLASPEGAEARQYLASRGITEESVQEFGLGFAKQNGRQLVEKLEHYGPELMRASGLFRERGEGSGVFYDAFRDRVMFPIQDAGQNVIAFGGRGIRVVHETGLAPKYLNSPQTEIFTKGETVYNLHRVAEAATSAGHTVVVEGYMDVIANHQAGVHNAIAPNGTALTEEQAGILKQMAPTAVLAMDSDAPGQKAAEKHVGMLLANGVLPKVATMPDGLDPDDVVRLKGAAEYRQVIASAKPVVPWLSEQAKAAVTPDPWTESVDIANRVSRSLQQAAPELRERLSAQLSDHLGLPKEAKEQNRSPAEHRAAWDIRFGAPKTVSLAGLVGGDDRVLDAHRRAVKEALDYGEEYIQARMGGNRPAFTTGKAAFALFEHDTARPVNGYPAPHLHTHVVLFNITDDGEKYRSLDPVELFRLQSTLNAVYHNRLAVDLKHAGYELTQGVNQAVEIKGFSEAYLKAASQRKEQIEQGKAELGRFGPIANQIVNYKTRAEKLDVSSETIRAAHQEQDRQFDGQAHQVVSEARTRSGEAYSEAYRRAIAHEGLTYAKQRLIERQAIFDESEVFRDALRFGRGYTTLADVRQAFEQREPGEFQQVGHWRQNAPGRRFTTPEMVRMEREILQTVHDGIGAVSPIANGLSRDEFRKQFSDRLNNGQMWLSWNAINSTDRIVGIQGVAGSGKTTALEPLRNFTERFGFEVLGLASTSGAVNELRDRGVKSQTIQSFLAARRNEQHRPRAYFVDESSLVDTQQLHKFMNRIRPADRVFLIGDSRQHSSIGAGRIFHEMQRAHMTTFRLEKIVRQKDDDFRQVIKEFSSGSVAKGLQILGDRDRLHEVPTRGKRYDAIAESYASTGMKTLVVSPDNQSRQDISDAIREKLQESGDLSPNVYRGRMLNPRLDLTKEDKQHAMAYRPGDVIRYQFGSDQIGRKAGEYSSVVAIDPRRNSVTVMREKDGGIVEYNPRMVGFDPQVFEAVYTEFAIRDRVQFTSQWKERGVTNRQLGTITALNESGDVSVKLDKTGETVSWNLEQNGHLAHGYAMTSYTAQGSTVERVLLHIETDAPNLRGMVNRQLGYVGLSRASLDMELFTDDVKGLGNALSKSERTPVALSPEQVMDYRDLIDQKKERESMGMGVSL